jgi:hypothetical protein
MRFLNTWILANHNLAVLIDSVVEVKVGYEVWSYPKVRGYVVRKKGWRERGEAKSSFSWMNLFESLTVSMAFLMIEEQKIWMRTEDLTAVKYSLGLLDVMVTSISEEPVAVIRAVVH